ncbi:GAF domain-containing sensor histidine kinase [Crocosphaera sp. XPORK-15E]|uniref:GAF domain-containing sensor histidine kinase n=1 Tax=Crocosphaera sp. XPORK-15E TaxID=3110247 RepID=UPI002B214B48|nr:GAF domain-containing sensor histidine kinase [Crocosphaera sp. XPORK-15E]MEA5536399.1 GAF domain-containing sensor histidine kinase [Crocosphaera sp. XPORK-15E]
MSNSLKSKQLEKFLIKAITNSSNSSMMLGEIPKIIVNNFPVDFCLIIIGLDDSTPPNFTAHLKENQVKISSQIISDLMTQPWISKILNKEKIHSITNSENHSSGLGFAFFEEINIKSLLGIKTNFQGKSNGIILLGKTQDYTWTQTDKKLFREVADIVAISCYLSQLQLPQEEYLSVRDSGFSLSNIPKLLEENPILRLWWESTRKQLERQLESNKQLIYNMITIMSDQTRNPLAILKMGITMLRKREFSPEDLHKRLDALEEQWEKLNEINEKILQLKNLKSQKLVLTTKSIKLERFINEIITPYRSQWQENKRKYLDLVVEFSSALHQENSDKQPIEIETDEEYLRTVLQELLINAGKFSVSGTTVSLTINKEKSTHDPKIIINITNISDCISRKNLTYLFDPFYREQIVIDTAIPGIGLGLTIIKDRVQLLKGSIKVDCLPTDTPEHCKIIFRLILPQSLSSQQS